MQGRVVVVDDDESLRESLPDLLAALGFAATAFASAEQFLASDVLPETACLILDVAMPGMSGPELQEKLFAGGLAMPVIFITAEIDESVRASLLQRGAVACLFKPFTEKELQAALRAALSAA